MQKPNPGEEKRWKGVLRMWLPKEDGSEQDEWSKRSLKGMATAFEKSNPGYTWNWDERSLAGKYIGIIYRNEEWEYNGKTGWSKRPFRCTSIDKVREGAVKAPKDKPLKNKTTAPPFPTPAELTLSSAVAFADESVAWRQFIASSFSKNHLSFEKISFLLLKLK